jgi:transcriptional regulator with XRE-family HTH domain
MVEIKQRFATAMARSGVRTTTLAKAMGVSYQAVKKILDGKTKMLTPENNLKAALCLDVDPNWLALGQGKPRMATGFEGSNFDLFEEVTIRESVTPEHKEESARLKALWKSQAKSSRLSQKDFGDIYDIGTQSAVGFFLNGASTMSMKAAIGFAKGLSCEIADFSPRLAAKAATVAAAVSPAHRLMIQPDNPNDRDVLLYLRMRIESLPEHDRVQVCAALTLFIAKPETLESAVAALERPVSVLAPMSSNA